MKPCRIALALAATFSLSLQANAAEFPQGLVLHYAFDDASTTGTVSDKTGRGPVGRGTGLVWAAAGRLGGAVEFGVSNSLLAFPAAPALLTTQQTVSLWFKTGRTGAVERWLLDRLPAAGSGLALAGGPDAAQRGKLRFGSEGRNCFSDAPLTDGAWHHVAATCDGRQLRLYVDGRMQPQVAEVRGDRSIATNTLTLGMRRADPAATVKSGSFGGLVDEVMIFNHALSAEQVQAVRAAAQPKFSEADVKRRIAELDELLERGLILPEFHARKVRECKPDA